MAPRVVAAKLLAAVIDKKTSLDGLLDASHGNPAYLALSDIDRGLARALLQSALRHLPRIESIIAALLETPLPEGARSLHHILVIAAAQVLYLDVPDHSAVDLAVEQANADPRSRRFAKLVNAVMRRMVREKADLLQAAASIPAIPVWFDRRLQSIYGADHAAAIGRALLDPAAIDITVKSDPQGWAERLGGIVLPTGSVRLKDFKGSVTGLEGFDAGAWWVQDAAAAIPAQLFDDLRGKRVADLCAAPGGKTAQLIMRGGRVTAVELSSNRLERLRQNLARLRLEAALIQSDLTQYRPEFLFDAILLDAPCSSTGTLRRHPDVAWTKGPVDIEKLAAVQERLLRHALTLLAPGGQLVFSNCSLDPMEGEAMVARVIGSDPALSLVPVAANRFPGLEEAITAAGEIRTTPAMLANPGETDGGIDGFYACLIHKN